MLRAELGDLTVTAAGTTITFEATITVADAEGAPVLSRSVTYSGKDGPALQAAAEASFTKAGAAMLAKARADAAAASRYAGLRGAVKTALEAM